MDYSTPKQSFVNKRYPVPILDHLKKAFPPAGIVSDKGEKRNVESPVDYSTSKGKWFSFQGLVLLLLIVFLIYGAAIGSTGIMFYMVVGLCFLLFGEMFYSKVLMEYLFQLSSDEPVPANETFNQNNVDYHPTQPFVLTGHHFVSISGLAPIVGPAQAVYFGWLPCILWVVLGSIFCGSPADMGATILAARNNGKSIADLSGSVIQKRCGLIFVLMLVLLCWLIIAVFSNLIAGLWMSYPSSVLPVNIEILIAVGLAFLWSKFPSGWMHFISSLIVLILLFGVIFFSVWLDDVAGEPFKFDSLCENAVLADATCTFGQQQLWTIWIGFYVTIVATLPVWWVVQPRDTINSHQLIVTMVLAVLGIVAGGPKLSFPAVRTNLDPNVPFFPFLFVTIACGAISGFHSIVGSTVSSKQLRKMTTARTVGYTSMLLESCVSTLAILIVCSTTTEEDSFLTWADAGADGMTNFVEGAASYFNKLGIPIAPSRTIVTVMVVSFGATTVDTCGRIVRMLIAEFSIYIEWLTGVKDDNDYKLKLNPFQSFIKYLGFIVRIPFIGSLLALVPSIVLANTSVVNDIWTLFGATNQIVASLSLLTSAVYLVRLHDNFGKGALYFIPFLFITAACLYALGLQIRDWLAKQADPATYKGINYTVVVAAFLVLVITVWIFLEALIWMFRYFFKSQSEFDKSNFVKWDSQTKRTGYFRSLFPIGYETPISDTKVLESSSMQKQNSSTLFQRLSKNGISCC